MFRCAHRSSIILLIDAQLCPVRPTAWFVCLGLGLALRGNGQKINHPCNTLIDGRAQRAPMRPPRRLNILEGDNLASMFLAHRAAEELVAVENPDFGQVAWIIADGDRIADIGSQSGMAVTEPLEMNTVTPHGARFSMHDKQQIECIEAVGHAWQKACTAPSVK